VTRNQRGEPDLPPGPARELVTLFRRLRSESPLTVGQIAVRTRLAAGHVSEVLRGWKAPSPAAAVAIVRALGADERTELKVHQVAEELAELNRYNRARNRREAQAEQPGGTGSGSRPSLVILSDPAPGPPRRGGEVDTILGMLGDRETRPVIVLCGLEADQVVAGLARLLGLTVEPGQSQLRLTR
jgi:transcriptional regulator with XRE-family HTH domain